MKQLLGSLVLAILLVGGLWAGATAADLFDPPGAVVLSAVPTLIPLGP
jgi:hypothetical protein